MRSPGWPRCRSRFSTGDGSIGIMAGAMAAAAPGMPAQGQSRSIQYSGPFRIELQQLSLSRDFQAGTALANVRLEAAWEPRLRPMLLKLKADELKIVDDRKKEVKPQVAMESDEVVIRPENPSAEINSTWKPPSATPRSSPRCSVKAEVTIPAGIKTFKFPSLAQKDVTVKQGDVSLTLEDTEVDEQVWKVNVTLVYPGEGPAFESYRQGLFNNRLWLQRADGSRFEHNGGFSNTGSDGGKLGFEYLFVDAPGKPADYQLIYETPSKVITIPLEFEFKDVACREPALVNPRAWSAIRAGSRTRPRRSSGAVLNSVELAVRPYFWSFWVTLRRDRPLCRAQRATLPLYCESRRTKYSRSTWPIRSHVRSGSARSTSSSERGARRRAFAARPIRAGRRGAGSIRRPGRSPP